MAAPSTGLALDYDPALISGSPSDGDPVGTLPDTIGANNATSTGSARPLYRTAGPNSKPYVEFDGVAMFSKSGAVTAIAQPYRLFLVFRPKRYVTPQRIFDGQTADRTILSQHPVDIDAGSLSRGIQRYSLYAGTAFTASNPGGALTATGGQFGLLSALYNGASSSIAINRNTPTIGNPGASSFTGICFGSSTNQTAGYFSKFDLVRLLVYNSSIVSASAVETYLVSEYALTVPKFILCDGDSLTSGIGATGGNTYPAQLLALLGTTWSMIETGISGQTAVQMEADAATEIDGQLNTLSAKTILLAWGGTNDLYFGASAATAYSNYVTYCTNRRLAGWKVVAFTILPRSAGSPPVGFEASRQTFNTSVRTNWATFADALADVGVNGTIGPAGAELNITYYDDRFHLTSAGYAIVAGIARAAINTVALLTPLNLRVAA